MKKPIFILILLSVFLSFSVSAKGSTKDCTAETYCVDDSKFTAQIGKIRKRGKFVLLNINYFFKKPTTTFGSPFTVRFYNASLIDSEGNEAIIKQNQIEILKVAANGGKKNLSLKFKAEGFEWTDTFDLEIKANEPHGSIAFFDIKQN